MGIAIAQKNMSSNAYINKKAIILMVFFLILLAGFPVYAEELGDNLTDLFQTKVFKGSWEFMTEFGWMAGLMNWLISACCFIGMWLVIFNRIITLLYLTNRPLFDKIDDIKSSGKGQSFFGFKALFEDAFNSKHDSGADSILYFFLGLAPNIKRLSDYNPDNPNPALDEDDGVMNYMLKMLGPTVLIVLFLAMGYGGQLGKMYGMVVDGLMVVADEFVNYKLDDFIDDAIHSGENYAFTLGSDGSEEGKVKQNVANSIYKNVTSEYPLDTEDKAAIGRIIEDMVASKINAGSVKGFLPDGSNLDLNEDGSWEAIKVETVMNTNPTADNAIMTVNLKSDLGFTGEQEQYVHVYVSQSGNAGQNYFEP